MASSEMETLKRALDSGELDRKKHWKPFRAAVKRARKSRLSEEEISTLAAVDKYFFDQWHVPKVSILWGTVIFISLTFIAELAFLMVLFQVIPLSNILGTDELTVIGGFVVYLILTSLTYYSSHAVSHFIVGRPLGIKFYKYFIFRASFRRMYLFKKVPPFSWFAKIPMWVGIKYDLRSFLQAARWKRTLMFISAPILSNSTFVINYLLLMRFYQPWKAISMSTQLTVLVLILGFYIGSLSLSYFRFGDLWKARQDY